MAGTESVKDAMKYGRQVTVRGKAHTCALPLTVHVHVHVSNFRVKYESDDRYTIRDIVMFWHAILKRTLQERKNSA